MWLGVVSMIFQNFNFLTEKNEFYKKWQIFVCDFQEKYNFLKINCQASKLFFSGIRACSENVDRVLKTSK